MGWLNIVVYLFLKNTFFIMYLHIFRILRWFRICAYLGAAITTTFYISTTVAILVLTTPRRGETWAGHLSTKEERLAINVVPIATSSFGVVTDLAILILPMIAVLPMQLPIRRKIGVVCVFMTGLL